MWQPSKQEKEKLVIDKGFKMRKIFSFQGIKDGEKRGQLFSGDKKLYSLMILKTPNALVKPNNSFMSIFIFAILGICLYFLLYNPNSYFSISSGPMPIG